MEPKIHPADRSRGQGRSRGRGRGRRNQNWSGRRPYYPTGWPMQPPFPWPSQNAWQPQQNQFRPWYSWQAPPFPYPSTPQPNNKQGQGILGPRPPQAHNTTYPPTDIQQALYTMTLNSLDYSDGVMDSGATISMDPNSGNFRTIINNNMNENIIVGNGNTIPVIGHGPQTFKPPYPPFVLNRVLYAPNLIRKLISVRQFTRDNSVSIEFDPFGFLVKDYKSRTPIIRCDSSGDLYTFSTKAHCFSTSTVAAQSSTLWHQRLGHPGPALLQSLKNSNSITFKSLNKNICEPCVFGKSTRLPFHSSSNVTLQPFDIIHSDVWTSPVLSSGGHRYYVLFLDDYTNFLWTYPISNKSQVFTIFTTFAKMIQTQFQHTIKTFQCDNGKEYVNTSFKNFFDQYGILFRLSSPYTSSQNGKAERKIRSINNITRTLLAQSSLPNNLWHHALETATYLLNIIPSKTHQFKTPTQLLYHQLPTYDHLRVFGCLCYPLIPSTNIHKLEIRSHPCVFIGYPSSHRGYKCLDIKTNQLTISRHVLFDESTFPFARIKTTPNSTTYKFLTDSFPTHLWPNVSHPTSPYTAQTEYSSPPQGSPPSSPTNSQNPQPSATSPNPISPTTSPQDNSPAPTPPLHNRTMRTRAMDGIVKPKQIFNLHTNTIIPIPKSPTLALSIPEWRNAMANEFHALINNSTWELVPRDPNMNIIRCMWLFKHKYRSDGSLERYKARLVCDGRSQQVGIDCGDTFSPVVKPATIRTVLSIALSKSWPVHQLDVTNAFLHGHLHETVYMHQPMGFRSKEFPDHVCLLKKSLYGLKQAPRAWYQRFTDYVLTLGFVQSRCDTSLFILHSEGHTAYLLLYVDDILLVTSSTGLREHLLSLLFKEFAMKDLGTLSLFLGIHVKRTGDTMFLSQQSYASDIIERAGMTSCKPAATPVDANSKLSATSGTDFENPTLYRSLAGALQYLTFTRPDISYAVQQVCMHMHAPKTDHWNALKRIIRYIQGTLNLGLTLGSHKNPHLMAYTDADWAGCPDTRRSTSGYCVYYGDCLISWSSKRQPTISRSSAEAEYRGVANVVAEICWLRNLLLELHRPLTKATLVYCDNVSAIYLSGNPVQHQRTKHIELDIHFVREQVQRGQVRILHVPSRYQIADIFTKGLHQVLFEDFRSSLSIRSPPASTAGE